MYEVTVDKCFFVQHNGGHSLYEFDFCVFLHICMFRWKKPQKHLANHWTSTHNIKQILQSALAVLHEFLKIILQVIVRQCSSLENRMWIHRICYPIVSGEGKKEEEKVQE